VMSPLKFENTANATYSNLVKLLCNYEDIDKLHNLQNFNKKKKLQLSLKPPPQISAQDTRRQSMAKRRVGGILEDPFLEIQKGVNIENINKLQVLFCLNKC